MKIITFASWKGGTGKTSLGIATIENLCHKEYKILAIDLDSNLSMSSAYDKIGYKHNSVELLNGNNAAPAFIKKYLNFISSDLRISRLNNISDRVLKNQIKKNMHLEDDHGNFGFEHYDYIFIDPPGTMNALTRNAMVAADKIIIPAMISEIDYNAVKLIMEEMEICGVDADIQIILNRYDSKRNVESIEQLFKNDSDLSGFLYKDKIPAMKSISRLTSEVIDGYKLQGRANEIIDKFVEEVVK